MDQSAIGNNKYVWDRVVSILIIAGLFLIWEFLSYGGYISTLFFPAPSRILKNLWQMILNGALWPHLLATLGRLSLGLMLGAFPGVLLGLAMGWNPRLRRVVDPIVAAIHPIPKIALFPMILMLFGIGEASKIVAIGISVFFPVLINSMVGVQQIPPVYFEVAKNYGASSWKTFQRVVWPGSLAMILAGTRLGFAIALVISLAVELVAARTGLGVVIWSSWQTLRTGELYAAVIVIAVLGIVANLALKWMTSILVPWKEESSRAST
jgi:ABC-type nitrate/sulfonate/bicarbonate transport system permease component